MKAHCLFEQSGTFKNEFIKLGIPAFDYDIQNKFNLTDFQIDLFCEIEKAFKNEASIFDNFSSEDILFAFFPCTRFSINAQLTFNCYTPQLREWNLRDKLLYDIELHEELNKNYKLISKLVIVCIDKNLRLIIENPYSKEHYLVKYWAFKSQLQDFDRSIRGDNMKKPTQYYFLNCKPKNNIVENEFEIKTILIKEKDIGTNKRSTISPDYARRFIKEFIL